MEGDQSVVGAIPRGRADAVHDPEDLMPSVIDTAQWAAHFVKHPRSFVRSFVLNR